MTRGDILFVLAAITFLAVSCSLSTSDRHGLNGPSDHMERSR